MYYRRMFSFIIVGFILVAGYLYTVDVNNKKEAEANKVQNVQESENTKKEEAANKEIVSESTEKGSQKEAEDTEENQDNENQQEVEEMDKNGIQLFAEDIGDIDFANQIFDILHTDIGFSNIEYTGVLEGTANYQFNADGKDIIVTAYADDGFIRIFEPNGNVYYEDGEVQLTYEEEKENSISFADATSYYIMAQDIIINRMKNPGSVDFPSMNSGYVGFGKKENVILVTGYVDADNAFGATVRENFIVELIPISMKEFTYEIVYVKIGDYSEGELVEIP